MEGTPIAFFLSVLQLLDSMCTHNHKKNMQTKETKALVFCIEEQKRGLWELEVSGRSLSREKSRSQIHKVVHILLG